MFIGLYLSSLFQNHKGFAGVHGSDAPYGFPFRPEMREVMPENAVYVDLLRPTWEEDIRHTSGYRQFLQEKRNLIDFFKPYKVLTPDFLPLFTHGVVPDPLLDQYCGALAQCWEEMLDELGKVEDAFYQHSMEEFLLLEKIASQPLNINLTSLKRVGNLDELSRNKHYVGLAGILDKYRREEPMYIKYNPGGALTGRLGVYPGSFPILTMPRDLRQIIKPTNDFFLKMDYSAADMRTTMALVYPGEDFSDRNLYENISEWFGIEAEDYAHLKKSIITELYSRQPSSLQVELGVIDMLDQYVTYDARLGQFTRIVTPYGRHIFPVHERYTHKVQGLPLLIQSITNDHHLAAAIKINHHIERNGLRSRVAVLMHDEVTVDVANEDKEYVPLWQEMMEMTSMGRYKVKAQVGYSMSEVEEIS